MSNPKRTYTMADKAVAKTQRSTAAAIRRTPKLATLQSSPANASLQSSSAKAPLQSVQKINSVIPSTFDEIIRRFTQIDNFYYAKTSLEDPPYPYTFSGYLSLLKTFQTLVNVEKKKLTNYFNSMYDTLNKCMMMILNADGPKKKGNYSHFKKNEWCLLKEIKDRLFNEKNQFNLNISFTNRGLIFQEFNLERLIEDEDISSFFILFHKIHDMYNMLIIFSNILRNNNKQALIYDWVPERGTFMHKERLELNTQPYSLLQIPIIDKQNKELIIHNTIVLINKIQIIQLFFDVYAYWMQNPQGIQNNNGHTKGPFIPEAFTGNNEKIKNFFHYLTSTNIDETCNDAKYIIPKLPFRNSDVAGIKYREKIAKASANRASSTSNRASPSANGASTNGIIKVTVSKLNNNSNNGTQKKPLNNRGSSANNLPTIVYPRISQVVKNFKALLPASKPPNSSTTAAALPSAKTPAASWGNE
jgi:hypothetical protein